MATDPMNIDRPKFRRTRFATTGILQPIGPGPAQPAEDQRHDERSARHAQAEGAASGQRDRDHPKEQPECNPNPDRDERQFGVALDAVAEVAPDFGLTAGREWRHEAIAELERQIGRGNEFLSPRRTCEITTGKSGRAMSAVAFRRRPPLEHKPARHRSLHGPGSGVLAPLAPLTPWPVSMLAGLPSHQQPVTLLQSCPGHRPARSRDVANCDNLHVGGQIRQTSLPTVRSRIRARGSIPQPGRSAQVG